MVRPGLGKSAGVVASLALIAGLVVLAESASRFVAVVLPPILIGLVLGLLTRHFFDLPSALDPGIEFGATTVLRAGIVLLGLRTTFAGLLEPGVAAITIALVGLTLVFLLAGLLGSVSQTPRNAWLLLAVGTAICGNSAIVAAAPVLKARDREVAVAVGLITAFGTVALFVYPVVGNALGMDQVAFGTWAGTGINDTAQVVAAGEAYGSVAATTSVSVKLVRNILILPVVAGLAFMSRESSNATSGDRTGRLPWTRAFPPFVIGFLVLAGVASLGILPASVHETSNEASSLLLVAGMAAIGLRTRLGDVRTFGWSPIIVGLTLSLSLGLVSFFLVQMML